MWVVSPGDMLLDGDLLAAGESTDLVGKGSEKTSLSLYAQHHHGR